MSQERISSIQRFKRLAQELQDEIRSDAIDELNRSADELVEKMRSAAPVGRTGNLRKSIRKEAGKTATRVLIKAGGPLTTRRYQRAAQYVRGVVLGSGDTRGIARGGTAGVTYDYSRAVEFGTQDNPAHPFFWPSWRLRRKQIRSRMRRRITANIKKRSAV